MKPPHPWRWLGQGFSSSTSRPSRRWREELVPPLWASGHGHPHRCCPGCCLAGACLTAPAPSWHQSRLRGGARPTWHNTSPCLFLSPPALWPREPVTSRCPCGGLALSPRVAPRTDLDFLAGIHCTSLDGDFQAGPVDAAWSPSCLGRASVPLSHSPQLRWRLRPPGLPCRTLPLPRGSPSVHLCAVGRLPLRPGSRLLMEESRRRKPLQGGARGPRRLCELPAPPGSLGSARTRAGWEPRGRVLSSAGACPPQTQAPASLDVDPAEVLAAFSVHRQVGQPSLSRGTCLDSTRGLLAWLLLSG